MKGMKDSEKIGKRTRNTLGELTDCVLFRENDLDDSEPLLVTLPLPLLCLSSSSSLETWNSWNLKSKAKEK